MERIQTQLQGITLIGARGGRQGTGSSCAPERCMGLFFHRSAWELANLRRGRSGGWTVRNIIALSPAWRWLFDRPATEEDTITRSFGIMDTHSQCRRISTMRLGACVALACCGMSINAIPAEARDMTPSENARVQRALQDVQHTRELQALDKLERLVRAGDRTRYNHSERRRSRRP
jgi:hypothetical protein